LFVADFSIQSALLALVYERNLRHGRCCVGAVPMLLTRWEPDHVSRQLRKIFGNCFHQMVCVESGNVAENKITLAPGKSASLKVVLSSQPI
jgi:hypothetical protein